MRDLASTMSKNFPGVTPPDLLSGRGDPLPHPPPVRLHAASGGAIYPVAGT